MKTPGKYTTFNILCSRNENVFHLLNFLRLSKVARFKSFIFPFECFIIIMSANRLCKTFIFLFSVTSIYSVKKQLGKTRIFKIAKVYGL